MVRSRKAQIAIPTILSLMVLILSFSGCGGNWRTRIRQEYRKAMEKKKKALAVKPRLGARKAYIVARKELKAKGKSDYQLYYLTSGPDINRKTGSSAYWEYRFRSKDRKKVFEVVVEGGKVALSKESSIKKTRKGKPKKPAEPIPDNWLDSSQAIEIAEANFGKLQKGKSVTEKAFWMELIGNGVNSYWQVQYGTTYLGKDMKAVRVHSVTGKLLGIKKGLRL